MFTKKELLAISDAIDLALTRLDDILNYGGCDDDEAEELSELWTSLLAIDEKIDNITKE